MKTINAEAAAEAIFELFKAKQWLNKPGIMTQEDATAEAEALMFLHQLVTYGADNYGGTSEPAQRVAATLLNDFMAKLIHPQSPFRKKTWIVDDSKPMAEQALQIIGHEIAGNFPQPQEQH